jgi:prepilin-type N-terminal cleavage/methylation domain-containing protein
MTALPIPPLALRRSRAGFTLVELMVALTAGLFVSIVVFALAKQGSRFYQREARAANATLANVIGFQRLREDIARAGFLSTPNASRDPQVCGQNAWPNGALRSLASVRIVQGGSPDDGWFDTRGLSPDAIVIAGSFQSTDQFPVRTVVSTGAGAQVFLQVNSGPMSRIRYDSGDPDAVELLATAFPAGRVLRIVDTTGMQHFGVVSAHQAGPNPNITLADSPSLNFQGGLACGLRGNATGAMANLVQFMRYELRNLSGLAARYGALYTASADAPHEEARRELVRVELDPLSTTDGEFAGTEELVAEYAVDLKFGITAVNQVTAGANPTLLTLDPGDATIEDTAGDANTILAANQGPHFIRAVRVRLSTRSREADREADINAGADPSISAGLYRIGLGDDNSAPFARVRTIQADVALRNQPRAYFQ